MTSTFVTVLKVLASLTALYMVFSPSTSMYRIHKNRSTGVMSVIPLIGLFVGCHTWVVYGYVTDGYFPMVTTYAIGDLAAIGFIAIYYRWTEKRRYVAKVSAIVLVANVLLTAYAILGKEGVLSQPYSQVKLIVGYIGVAAAVSMYASPLATIALVIKTKSAESVPVAMVLVGFVNNFLWTLYGLLIDDMFIFGCCLASEIVCILQIGVYIVYNPKKRAGLSQELPDVEHELSTVPHHGQRKASLSSSVAIPSQEIDLTSIQIENGGGFVALQSPSRSNAAC
ncbi:hypothetical protein Poli38472_013133 [Pythium oligandrum]|uniref:MtN3-like protein n=1 Tax=Pythium oligandrum TaxID=41045 RepID=A0A8K1C324_PYTOL|nr:hypothetical protein Poli38472_013133 [Pythium oligandrum]|eukprot:TMW55242.1 hypothetical protein Poli38472_013133 [Pythium oligandrum]